MQKTTRTQMEYFENSYIGFPDGPLASHAEIFYGHFYLLILGLVFTYCTVDTYSIYNVLHSLSHPHTDGNLLVHVNTRHIFVGILQCICLTHTRYHHFRHNYT